MLGNSGTYYPGNNNKNYVPGGSNFGANGFNPVSGAVTENTDSNSRNGWNTNQSYFE